MKMKASKKRRSASAEKSEDDGKKGALTVTQARTIVRTAHMRGGTPIGAGKQAEPMTPARTPPQGSKRRAALGVPAAKPTVASVAAERRALEKRKRDEREQRIREYKATYKLLEDRGVMGLTSGKPAGAQRRRALGPAAAAKTEPLRVFAEGDSWFDYPPHLFRGGLVPRLEKRLGVPILDLSDAGDETRFMLGVKQRKIIVRHLKEGGPGGKPWELMLFSGGGNDIVAEPLALWLNDFASGKPPEKLLNAGRFASAVALVRAAYEDLIAVRDELSPNTHLMFHAYDFAIPDGRGVCGLGPWLKPAFDLRGFPANLTASTAVVKVMLQQFAAMLKDLAKQPRITIVDSQGTLTPVKASWHNELHPSSDGFDLVADKFHKAVKTVFPGRVL
jgi:hypothetical protein